MNDRARVLDYIHFIVPFRPCRPSSLGASHYLLSLHWTGPAIDEQCDLQNPAALNGKRQIRTVKYRDQVPVCNGKVRLSWALSHGLT